MSLRRAAGFGLVIGPVVVAASELAHRRAARRHRPPEGTVEVVVVLGCGGSPDGAPSPTQRRRVNAGVQALRDSGARELIMTGGRVTTPEVQALTMAEIATELGVPAHQQRCETESTTTWENVHNVRTMVAPDDRVLLVSNPLHAARARRHWLGIHPEDGERVFTIGRPAPLRAWPRSLLVAVYETAAALRHLTRDPTARHSRTSNH